MVYSGPTGFEIAERCALGVPLVLCENRVAARRARMDKKGELT